jgi:hypothetical protein
MLEDTAPLVLVEVREEAAPSLLIGVGKPMAPFPRESRNSVASTAGVALAYPRHWAFHLDETQVFSSDPHLMRLSVTAPYGQFGPVAAYFALRAGAGVFKDMK